MTFYAAGKITDIRQTSNNTSEVYISLPPTNIKVAIFLKGSGNITGISSSYSAPIQSIHNSSVTAIPEARALKRTHQPTTQINIQTAKLPHIDDSS